MKSANETIFDLLSKNKIKDAISFLKNCIESSSDLEILIIQSARYTEIIRQIHLNTVDHSIANIEINKIRLALVELAIEVDENITNSTQICNDLNNKSVFQQHSGSGDNILGDKIVYK